MLFGKRKQVVKRILIVEDEPLTAFDNENILSDAGYEIVATVDDLDEALAVLDREEVDLDLERRSPEGPEEPGSSLRGRPGNGRPDDVRYRAPLSRERRRSPSAAYLNLITKRQLTKAIECVDRHLQGEKVKPPKGFELFVADR